jgi:putative transposase
LSVVDLFFGQLYAFFIMELGSRRIVHFGVTLHPTDEWVGQQLQEATPFDQKPKYLIQDNDAKYGTTIARVAMGTNIEVLKTPIRAPNANAMCERLRGSVRRECLGHFLILNERHLFKVLKAHIDYYNRQRPHQGVWQALPVPEPHTATSHSKEQGEARYALSQEVLQAGKGSDRLHSRASDHRWTRLLPSGNT